MAFGSSDFVYENVFDAITAVIEVNILQNDEVLNLETNLCIRKALSLQCGFCGKVHLLSGGLKRHVTKKHPSSKALKNSASGCLGSDLVSFRLSWIRSSPHRKMKMKPLIWNFSLEKSICKLAQDECYPDVTLRQGPTE